MDQMQGCKGHNIFVLSKVTKYTKNERMAF